MSRDICKAIVRDAPRVSRARLVITAITKQGLTQAEAARTYGLSEATVSRLMARYRDEGDGAFEPRSRRPRTSPGATAAETVDLVLRLRKQLLEAGHDAGAETLGWHLAHHHAITLSRATIHRILTRHGAVTPEPKKRPKSSYIRFEAAMPNQTWQSDFTHYPLTDTTTFPKGVEIITWLDDCTRYALHVSARTGRSPPRSSTPHSAKPQVSTASPHPPSPTTGWSTPSAWPASDTAAAATDSSSSSATGTWSRRTPDPTTPPPAARSRRFQQTMKKWLRAQPVQPSTIADLQSLLDRFRHEYNHHPTAPLPAAPGHSGSALRHHAQGPARPQPRRRHPRPDPTRHRRQSPAPSPCASPASSATSASAEPTTEPTSSCSSRTSTYASSTPSPASFYASSPSTPARTTNPGNEQDPNPRPWVRILHMS